MFNNYGEPRTQLSKESVWIALSTVDLERESGTVKKVQNMRVGSQNIGVCKPDEVLLCCKCEEGQSHQTQHS